jgi:hypothetical protein
MPKPSIVWLLNTHRVLEKGGEESARGVRLVKDKVVYKLQTNGTKDILSQTTINSKNQCQHQIDRSKEYFNECEVFQKLPYFKLMQNR